MTFAAVQAAKQRHQQTLQTLFPGSVRIGTAYYTAALTAGAVSELPADNGSGFRSVQSLNVSILKSLLATAPSIGTEITAQGKTWKIETISGHDALEMAWQITALHFPKSS